MKPSLTVSTVLLLNFKEMSISIGNSGFGTAALNEAECTEIIQF